MICTHKIKHYTNISLAENIFKEKILRIANDDPLNGDSVFNAKSYGEWLGNIFSAENTNCYIEFKWVGPCKDFFQNVTDKYPPDKWKDVENSILYNEKYDTGSFRHFIRGPINKNCSLKIVGVCELPASAGDCKTRNKWLGKFMKILENKFGTRVQRKIKELNKLCKNKDLVVKVQGVKRNSVVSQR